MVRGDLEGEGDLLVEGRVEGRLKTRAVLSIEPGAHVEAEIEAARVRIAGVVIGTVVAGQSIAIEKGAVVQGTLRAPALAIADGAVVRCRMEMAVDLPEDAR